MYQTPREGAVVRILLLHPPLWSLKSPPLNVTYLAAVCRRAGHQVQVIDANAEWFHLAGESQRVCWDRAYQFRWEDAAAYGQVVLPQIVAPLLPGLVERCATFEPDLIGISVNSGMLARSLARALDGRLPGVPRVVGGQTCYPDFHGRELLETGLFHAVVYGEGEETFLEIAERVVSGRPLTGAAGTLVRYAGRTVDGGPRASIRDLDSLPFPDFSDLDLSLYSEDSKPPYTPSQWLTILGSRGCVCRCDFCLQRVIWNREYRNRSAASLIEEMDHGFETCGLSRFHFSDLAINNDYRQLMELCDGLTRRGTPYQFGGNASIDRRIDEGYARRLRAAGCQFLTIGIESGSDTVLSAMRKRYSVRHMAMALGHLRDVGIRVFTNLVVGHPSEALKEFEQTVRFIRDHADLFADPPSSALCLIQPGTPLYEKQEDYDLYVEGQDTAGWYEFMGINDLQERRRRAALLDELYRELYGHGICMTDSGNPRLEPRSS